MKAELSVTQSDRAFNNPLKVYAGDKFYPPANAIISEVTYSPSTTRTPFIFGNEELKEAVDLWVSNKNEAIERYGDIHDWGTGEVTDMHQLFHVKENFNDDITKWDVSQVTKMAVSTMFQSLLFGF